MKCTCRVVRSVLAGLGFAVSLTLFGGATPANAGSWGSTQWVDNWQVIDTHGSRYWNNHEWEAYTPNCVWYEGSTLVIKSYFDGTTYWSGRVESWPTYGYGAYSFVANLPSGKGLLPAVWACTMNPWLPEMDAGEIPYNNGQVFQTFHDWNNNQTQWNRWGNWSNNWHEYKFVWMPDHIDYWVDGSFTGTAWYSTGNVGMHFIVNTAIGGDWPGPPDWTTWNTSDGARYLKCRSITYQPYYP